MTLRQSGSLVHARRPGPFARRRLVRVTLAALAFAAVGSAAALAAYDDDSSAANVDLGRVAAVRSNVVYEAAVARLVTDPAPTARSELALPPRAAYEDLVRRTAGDAGPIVLDFESLYLRGAPADAQRRFQKLRTLLTWAHEAAPGRAVGYYGVLGNTAPPYAPLERALAAQEDALFPGLYAGDTDFGAWQANFRRVMAEARAVAPGKPVYAYLWPSYHGGTKRPATYPAPAHLRRELDEAMRECAGVAVWSGWGAAGTQGTGTPGTPGASGASVVSSTSDLSDAAVPAAGALSTGR